ncbi:hypothetical protein M433DRAFT_324508 [Acidomyces richmondensis BFW]|nr:MAG: hypothetical protein FE78DRAFT_487467 [Acidomyces sp. 'richmondensis']KYG44012.1 hypothetical protein M433DRAFT_324508 [Acidomyces richmondensis BFW]
MSGCCLYVLPPLKSGNLSSMYLIPCLLVLFLYIDQIDSKSCVDKVNPCFMLITAWC